MDPDFFHIRHIYYFAVMESIGGPFGGGKGVEMAWPAWNGSHQCVFIRAAGKNAAARATKGRSAGRRQTA